MDAKKLDGIFRKRLTKHETNPSDGAWAQMEGLLDEEKKGGYPIWIYRSAAVVVILMLCTWGYQEIMTLKGNGIANHELRQLKSKKLEIALIRPAIPEFRKVSLALPKSERLVLVEDSTLKGAKQSSDIEYVQERVIDSEELLVQEVDAQSDEILANNENQISKPTKKRLPIKVTYKRGNRQSLLAIEKEDSLKKGLLGNIKPDLWADIRDAKNRAISNALDFNKNKEKDSNQK